MLVRPGGLLLLAGLFASMIPAVLLMPGVIAGARAAAESASEIHSDFNGDGFEDLAIGAPRERTTGDISQAGAVHVIYGSGLGGLQISSPADQFWHQDSPGIADQGEFNEFFGWALAAGDFNADGFSDLAIGVPNENIGTVHQAGAVHILYGTASSGLQTTSPQAQFWHQDVAGVEDVAELNDSFGSSLATGDLNGDGYADLAIGATSESLGSIFYAGAVHVLYGSSSGLQTSSPADQFWTQDSPGVEGSPGSSDLFSGSLAIGDFNNDGKDDLVIGAAWEEIGTGDNGNNAGGVHVLYGSVNGVQTSSPADQFWHQNSPGVDDTVEQSDQFGWSLAAADFNGDGYEDLAVGADLESIGIRVGAGAVHVFYGSSSGLQTSSPADQFWHQNIPDVENYIRNEDFFGFSLATGDFNSDGYFDMAIGVGFEDIGTNGDAGAVHVLYGSSSGIQTSSPADQFWHQNSPGVLDVAEATDYFGYSLTVADFNGDSKDDLAIGVPGEHIGAGTENSSGAVNVLYGSLSGVQSSSPADQYWNQNTPGLEDTAEFGDEFGYALPS